MIQHPIRAPLTPSHVPAEPTPASLAYDTAAPTNPSPFLLSPILNLPVSFGSAYVGEVFSCTLCANHDVVEQPAVAGPPGAPPTAAAPPKRKSIRDVRIEAEMKTPGAGAVQKLELSPPDDDGADGAKGTDLEPAETLQRIVNFDLKEEGNHVLAVTVSYYEATETSGKTRTFRKLYQFICKSSLIVRTKIGPLSQAADGRRRWVLEAQLENCSEDVIQLEKVLLDLEEGLGYTDCNWEGENGAARPVLHPGEVEQVCFVVEEAEGAAQAQPGEDGRILFGVLGIGWRGEMGNRGFLSTGKLGTRHVA